MTEYIIIKNLDGSNTEFDKSILDDPKHFLHDLCKQEYERSLKIKYKIDFKIFTLLTDEEVNTNLVKTEDINISEFQDCLKWTANQVESYEPDVQIQNIILDRNESGFNLCGCLGPNLKLGYVLCPCKQSRALYKYRYNIYKYFRDKVSVGS